MCYVPPVVVSIVVVDTLTSCALLHSVCDSKCAKMNVQCREVGHLHNFSKRIQSCWTNYQNIANPLIYLSISPLLRMKRRLITNLFFEANNFRGNLLFMIPILSFTKLNLVWHKIRIKLTNNSLLVLWSSHSDSGW